MRWVLGCSVFIIVILFVKSINLLGLPLYLDEGLYIFWAKLFTQSDGFAYVSLQDGKTPLFIWMVKWLNPLFNNYLYTGRLLSVLFGGITLASWLAISYKVFGKQVAIFFLILMAVVPYGFLIERMSLVDSMLTALGSTAILFFYLGFNYIKEKKNIFFVIIFIFLSGISLGLAFLTKTTAKVFLVAQIIIGIYWTAEFVKAKQYKKTILLTISLIIISLCFFEIMGYLKIGAHRFWGEIAIKEHQLTFSQDEVIDRVFHIYDVNIYPHYIKTLKLTINYFITYFSTITLLLLVGVYLIIKQKREYLWILIYALLLISAVILFGKVTASRYFYIAVPALIAIASFGASILWRSKSRKNWVILIIFLVAIQSLLMVISPQKAIYTEDDKSYLLVSNLSALGLQESIKLINPQNSVVGLTGMWGVLEGSQVSFNEAGVETVNLERWLNKNDLNEAKMCNEDQKKIDNFCWSVNLYGLQDNKKVNKYIYFTRGDEDLKVLEQFYPFEIVREFTRSGSTGKTYLIKLLPEL